MGGPWHERDLADAGTWDRFEERVRSATADDVERALGRRPEAPADLAALLSVAAGERLEELAAAAAAETRRRFGRVVVLYVPLYLSNECTNRCSYCGFSREQDIPRATLDEGQVGAEFDRLKEHHFDHVLLLTGEDRRAAPVAYVRDAVARAHDRFASVGIEVYPMERGEYAELVAAGCEAITLYQETYHQPSYRTIHPGGPKRDFQRRLRAPADAAAAGMRSVGIGALLGLRDWRVEGMFLGLHGHVLRRAHWRTRLSIGFPRLHAQPDGSPPPVSMTERELTQLICAMRLAFPDADLVLSTRERAAFRDGMVGIGVTRMSAGSCTRPGGYAVDDGAGEQFAVVDDRDPAQVAATIEAGGFEAVWKDWDRGFLD
jgi:2-iminoacetate synthase